MQLFNVSEASGVNYNDIDKWTLKRILTYINLKNKQNHGRKNI